MDREVIVDEIQTILRDQVESQTEYEPERKLLTAQTLFTIMDHIGVWMRRKRQDLARTSRRPRIAQGGEDVLAGVESIMRRISQELLAQASMQCKAYSRALLNFELRVRTMRNDGKTDHDMQTYYENMHRIYAHLDEPDGMEGISTRSSRLPSSIRSVNTNPLVDGPQRKVVGKSSCKGDRTIQTCISVCCAVSAILVITTRCAHISVVL